MGYTNDLKAAYTEQLLKNHIGGNPINDITKVNKGGIDYSALSGNKLVIGEAKAVKSLSMSDLENYILTDKVTGKTSFNVNYVIKHLGTDSYFTDPNINKEFVLLINSPVSSEIKSRLISQMGGLTEVPYTYKVDNVMYSGNIKVVIEAVSM